MQARDAARVKQHDAHVRRLAELTAELQGLRVSELRERALEEGAKTGRASGLSREMAVKLATVTVDDAASGPTPRDSLYALILACHPFTFDAELAAHEVARTDANRLYHRQQALHANRVSERAHIPGWLADLYRATSVHIHMYDIVCSATDRRVDGGAGGHGAVGAAAAGLPRGGTGRDGTASYGKQVRGVTS